ncbi:MAG TPA: hypothetical protein DER64_03880 [Planctomycetaceae bacterium]|nr:hypothetical protein [Planctomycetaceae bacterium]
MSWIFTNRRPVLIGLVVLGIVVAGWWAAHETPGEKLARAERLLAAGQFEEAGRLAETVPGTANEAWEAWVLAGNAFTRGREYDRAISVYDRVPDRAGRLAAAARSGTAAVLLDQRMLSKAEEQLRRLEVIRPDHPLVGEGLAHIFNVSARRHEAVPRMLAAAVSGQGPPQAELLVMLADIERPFGGLEYLELCRKADPADPLPVLGQAAAALAENDTERAEALVREVLDGGTIKADELARGVADRILGLILAETVRDVDFLDWHNRLPAEADTDPLVWLARGLHVHRRGRIGEAARCLWEALVRQPNLRQANHLLGQCLKSLGRDDDAKVFLDRAQQLEQLVRVLEHVEVRLQASFTERDAALWKEMVEQLQVLGRVAEARHWARVAISRNLSLGWARRWLSRPSGRIQADPLKQTAVSAQPALRIDLSDLPLPDWKQPAGRTDVSGGAGPGEPGRIRFEDITRKAGIDFSYFQSPDTATPGARMFENTGGGVAVLDFDGDGWPDLYFTQGCRWPVDPVKADQDRKHVFLDRLYRNNGDGTFGDVTRTAGLGDERFSQGVAVGDIDHDGWPDLYVANIGDNRLYRNNGDGTFDEWPIGRDEPSERWTTSCVVADIDGDGHVDLYDVNYLSGPGVFTKICRTQGVPFACHPNEFDGAQDRFWRGDGAGGFVDATSVGGFVIGNGKGLGIVAARFRGASGAASRPGLGLFVANDAVANFFFVTGEKGARDEALLRGVAYDRDGRPQACMGVAAGDVDGDGRLDLFITNFYAESNVLYRQGEGGHFSDVTRIAGLREPGWKMLGFGTQFLDADLDGELDLVVTNGHVEDFPDNHTLYEMPAQYLHNTGGGRFVELKADRVGEFFNKHVLGRGMARLDWNRDGLNDVLISHMDAPVALLTCTSATHGHYVAIRLRATSSARDAIGTQLTLSAGDRKLYRQQTAGDGYMASNQRQLIFGTGNLTAVGPLEVRWPSGRVDTFTDVPVDCELMLVEGRQPIRVPR